jgi:hypothetical protein
MTGMSGQIQKDDKFGMDDGNWQLRAEAWKLKNIS